MAEPPTVSYDTVPLRTAVAAALAGIVVAVALLATAPMVPMVWDEGDAILRAEQIPHAWPYTVEREGHPALYGIVIRLGRWLSSRWLPPLVSYRLGPMLLFSLAAGAAFYRMARDYSIAAATGAVAALLLMPRLFAHAHFASFDGPLTSCWLLAWVAFVPVAKGSLTASSSSETLGESHRGIVEYRKFIAWAAFGLALGLTMSCKATGWLAPVPFWAWMAVYRRRLLLPVSAVALPVALAAFFVVNPSLWHDPLGGLAAFLQMNLNRAEQPGLNIATQFFGRLYDLHHPLPWYNTLVWTAITVPVGILALGLIGATRAMRQWRGQPLGMLLVFNWIVLLVVRALPGTPPHDAERLILPSFAFLALLAGVGCDAVCHWHIRRRSRHSSRHTPCADSSSSRHTPCADSSSSRHTPCADSISSRHTPCAESAYRHTECAGYCAGYYLAIALYLGSLTSLVWYAPQWLSYYNLLIGGLSGAAAVGMEPTYYWDALDRPVLDWLEAHTAEDEKVCFAAAPTENLELLRRWGIFRRGTREDDPGAYRWVVVQNRPSGLQPPEARLRAEAQPALVKTIRRGGWGPWRLDVPLLEVYNR